MASASPARYANSRSGLKPQAYMRQEMAEYVMRSDAKAQQALDAAGIDSICERLTRGASMRQVAEAHGVSAASLEVWVQAQPERMVRVRDARWRSAEFWDDEAERVLQEATDKDALAKARELANHYRWRAKIRKPQEYGDKVQVDSTVEVKSDPGQVEAQLRALLSQGGYALPTQGQVIEHTSAEEDEA